MLLLLGEYRGLGSHRTILTTNQVFAFCEFTSEDQWGTLPWEKTAIMPSTKITVNSNGSLKVEGDFEIVDPQGHPYGLQGRTTVSLCRCGRTANKPFCDGSHKGNFEHVASAFELPPRKV